MKFQYEILKTETVYKGFLKLNRYRLRHELYLGGESETLERERLENLRAAGVLLYEACSGRPPFGDGAGDLVRFRAPVGPASIPGGRWHSQRGDDAPWAAGRRAAPGDGSRLVRRQ